MTQYSEHDEVNKKLNHLKTIIAIDIAAGKESGTNLNAKSATMKFSTVITSAVLTIILGLKLADWWNGWGSNIALTLSAILTALNTWDAFAKYESRSNQELVTTNKLVLLFKRISLTQVGSTSMKLEQYTKFETDYQQIQEEYMELREASNAAPTDPPSPTGQNQNATF